MKIKRINIGYIMTDDKQGLRIMPTYFLKKDGSINIRTNGCGVIGFSNIEELENYVKENGGYPHALYLHRNDRKLEVLFFRFCPFSIYEFMENYTIEQCDDGYNVIDNKNIIANFPSAESMCYKTANGEVFVGVLTDMTPRRPIDDWNSELIKTEQKLKYDKAKTKYCKNILNYSPKQW